MGIGDGYAKCGEVLLICIHLNLYKPDSKPLMTGTKCKLVSMLKEKIEELEAQVSTLHVIKENRHFLDKSHMRLALEMLIEDKWQHVTTRRWIPKIQEEQVEVDKCF